MKDNPEPDLILLIAHQLRIPLVDNKWAITEFINDNKEAFTSSAQSVLMEIYDNNERAIKMTNDVLQAGVSNSSLVDFKNKSVNISKLIQDVIERFTAKTIKKKILINFDFPKELEIIITADFDRLNYVFDNLIDNALKYSKVGGSISVKIKEEAGLVIVEVSDQGLGIPDSERNNIFNKFFRASNIGQTDDYGSGFGLFISKKIVEKHGGKIWFESSEGKGTTFHVSLPINKLV